MKQSSIKTPTKVSGYTNSGVSASNDFGSFTEKKEDGMKVCRGPFNVNCTTSKDPQLVFFEMVKSLELQKISYKKVKPITLKLISV
jgi:hypothetical protein